MRYTCLGYEDGSVILSIVKVSTDKPELLKQYFTNYSATVSAILFLNTGQLLVAATWEGVILYFDVEAGFDDATYVEQSRDYDAVTSVCTAKRLGKCQKKIKKTSKKKFKKKKFKKKKIQKQNSQKISKKVKKNFFGRLSNL